MGSWAFPVIMMIIIIMIIVIMIIVIHYLFLDEFLAFLREHMYQVELGRN